MAILLTKVGDTYTWLGGFETKEVPKQAGFRWSPEARRWWTKLPEVASKLIQYADPETTTELQQYLDSKEESLSLSRAIKADVDLIKPEGLEYLPFQKAGIRYVQDRQSTLLGDEMGLGKTIQALGVINNNPDIKTVLVICPATPRLNWEREAKKWLVRPFTYYVVNSSDPVPEDATFVITNYDRLNNSVLKSLMFRRWDCLVVDEAHRLKGRDALRTKRILGYWEKKTQSVVEGLIHHADIKLFLTGTPICNRPVEMHTILASLAPQQFGNFMKFAKRYCDAHETRYGWDFTGASNLDELQERLRTTIMVRRLKSEVLKELPPKRRQVIVLPANGASAHISAERKAYSTWQERLYGYKSVADLAHASGDVEDYKQAVKALRNAVQAAFSEISKLRHETAVAKVPAVIEFLSDILEQEDKVVVFAHHHDVIDQIKEHFKDVSVVITGDTSITKRQEAIDRFQNDPEVKLFIGNIQAAGESITLTAASHVVFAELDWVPGNVTQAEDRCHRIGQTDSVLVQHLVLEDSLDAHMSQVLIDKQEVLDKALDLMPEVREEPVLPLITEKEDRPKKYPEAIEEERNRVTMALRTLAANCDGARMIDGKGFNKVDASVGRQLAEKSYKNPLTDGEVWLGSRVVAKYHKQLEFQV